MGFAFVKGPTPAIGAGERGSCNGLVGKYGLVKFVTTEFGECAARSRCAMVAWRHDCGVEDVEKYVIRGATARPMSAVVGKVEADHQGLAWVRPWKVGIEAGIPENLHGMGWTASLAVACGGWGTGSAVGPRQRGACWLCAAGHS